jgi:hypothetical protein
MEQRRVNLEFNYIRWNGTVSKLSSCHLFIETFPWDWNDRGTSTKTTVRLASFPPEI